MNLIATYDRAAHDWDRKAARFGYPACYADFLDGRVLPQGLVLDAGTGTGALATAWLCAGGSREIALLDISVRMLAIARARLVALGARVRHTRGEVEALAPDAVHAAVLAGHVIEHARDPGEAMRRLAATLMPGGQLYLVVSQPHWCNWLIWLRYRHRTFSEGEVRAMAQAAGLDYAITHRFTAGPPRRTSLAYVFVKPIQQP